MQFCDKCGTMLQPTRKDGEIIMICPKCGQENAKLSKEGAVLKKEIKHAEEEGLVVIENPDELKTMPVKKMHCPKCKKVVDAEYWSVQTRSGDEAPTRFYRCRKCRATWREYD